MQLQDIYMRRAIELAELGAGMVSPNPLVGAVIVHNEKVIGEGYHQKYGQAHAEVNAITMVSDRFDDAADLLQDATMYVTLEPCAHFGKTPPCADLIIKHRIPRVVIGSPDPFSQVSGKGIQRLKDAGVTVTENFMRTECDHMNRRFLTRINRQRPYIILKWAQSDDGFMAPDNALPYWISTQESNILNHRWRTEEDAILIGKTTAMRDDPQLTVRHWTGRNPVRIVIDKDLKLPPNLRIFNDDQTCIIFNSHKTDIKGNLKYLWLEDFDNYLPQMIAYQLYLMDIQSFIVEGGAQTLKLFTKAGLWDEARILISPERWHSGLPAPLVTGSKELIYQESRDQIRVLYK